MSITKPYQVPVGLDPEATPAADHTRALVLIVDDDEANRADVQELLTEQGYEVVEATQGKQALEYLVSRRERVPDAIVLDLSMPVMTGWELLAILKAYVRLATIPVVLLSGVEPELDPVRHGVISSYLRKPFTAQALIDAVAKAAGRPRAIVARS
jgi:CheY-like chemotaxis protein